MIKDRNVLEIESSVKVFERAWGWMKLLGATASIVVAIGATVFAWNIHDLRSAVNNAKTTVNQSAAEARTEIGEISGSSLGEIRQAAKNATDTSQRTNQNFTRLANDLDRTASKTKAELAAEAASVRQGVAASQTELSNANKLRPAIESLQTQLTKATTDLAEQKKLLSSSEDFAKKIFSSRVEVGFGFVPPFPADGALSAPTMAAPNYAILPPLGGKGITVVCLLLPSAPILNTVQLQYAFALQPTNTFSVIHNMLIFFWGDPTDALKQKALTASYFPDTSDTEVIKSLSVKEGRIFADDQPLPKMNQPDLDFKGNKWIKLVDSKTGQSVNPIPEKK